MAPESMARKVMGDQFVDHFGATRMHEWETFTSTVTSWETAVRLPFCPKRVLIEKCSDTWNWLDFSEYYCNAGYMKYRLCTMRTSYSLSAFLPGTSGGGAVWKT